MMEAIVVAATFNHGLQQWCQAAMEVLMQVLWTLRDVAVGAAADGTMWVNGWWRTMRWRWGGGTVYGRRVEEVCECTVVMSEIFLNV